MTLAGGVVDRAVMAARFPGYYTRYVGEGEIAAIQQTGLLRGGRPGRTYITTSRFETSEHALSRLALRYPPGYRIEFKIVNQLHLHGPQRVRPWFWPRDPGFRAGWGIEYWTEDLVQVEILRINRLR